MRDPRFFQNVGSFHYDISWLCFDFSKNYQNFERNENRANVFLKWTDFKWVNTSYLFLFHAHPRPTYRTFRKLCTFSEHSSFYCKVYEFIPTDSKAVTDMKFQDVSLFTKTCSTSAPHYVHALLLTQGFKIKKCKWRKQSEPNIDYIIITD